MALEPKTETQYGVARGETLIGSLTSDRNAAQRAHADVIGKAASIGIEDTAELVTTEAKTTYSKLKAYKPEPEQAEEPTE